MKLGLWISWLHQAQMFPPSLWSVDSPTTFSELSLELVKENAIYTIILFLFDSGEQNSTPVIEYHTLS